ncbi:MAG: GspE/PulE family protein [Armatimonadetes bacterium]|nr:GspE/PulE family protein [Armatimonadota bacterium]
MQTAARPRRIGDLFVQKGLVTPEQMDEIQDLQKQSSSKVTVGELLVQRGLITPKDRDRCLAELLEYPFVDLSGVTPDREALDLLKPDYARKHKVLPLYKEFGLLTVVTTVPPNIYIQDEIRALSGVKEVQLQVATEEELLQAIGDHYRSGEQMKEQMADIMRSLSAHQVLLEDEKTTEDLAIDADESEVIRIANMIIARGLDQKASDIHVQPARDRVRVRYRVDGILRDDFSFPPTVKNALLSRLKVMSGMDIANRRTAQDGRITRTYDGTDFDFRVASIPGVYGEKIVIRILDKSALTLGLSNLGFLPENLKRLRDLYARPYGIVLVTGPTGSGKSTTLYSVLNELNTEDKNIVTVEDPVEYNLDGITQVGVNNQAGLTFAAALRNILRQDPDIIMLGEIRDRETATIACEAALTGHLVLATLHTNDAAGAVTRLTELEVEPAMISSALNGVLAQRLVRRLCPGCREEYSPPREILQRFNFSTDEENDVRLFHNSPKGCPKCKLGYKGRTGVHELLAVDEEMRSMILKRVSSYEMKDCAVRNGMTTLADDVRDKMLMGQTSLEEALRVVYVD